jgi:hypothetical protein
MRYSPHSFCKWKRGEKDERESDQAQSVQGHAIGRKGQRKDQVRADLRQGGDRGTPRPYLLILAIQDEMMKAREGELKSKVQPQVLGSPTQSSPVKSSLKNQAARRRGGIKKWQQAPVTSQAWRKG